MANLSITNETVSDFTFECGKNSAICATAALIVGGPIAGAAVFGVVAHLADKVARWIGHQVFVIDNVSMDKVSSQGYTQKFMHAVRLTMQIAAAILATSTLAYFAIKAATAYGLTEVTLATLSEAMTYADALVLTATALITNFAITKLYHQIMD
jgi:hypothetical protein